MRTWPIVVPAALSVIHLSCSAGKANTTSSDARRASAALAELAAPTAVGGGPRMFSASDRLAAARCDYLARCSPPADAACMDHQHQWLERRLACRDVDAVSVDACVRAMKEQSCDRLLEVVAGIAECSSDTLCKNGGAP